MITWRKRWLLQKILTTIKKGAAAHARFSDKGQPEDPRERLGIDLQNRMTLNAGLVHNGHPNSLEANMPLYQVRYRGDKELSFNSPSILREEQIVERVLAEEQIAPRLLLDKPRGGKQEPGPSLQEVIAANNLAPIVYTEDESEPITIA
ncbi:hypothetical protein [Duganella caerulea]|uniref:hypothetical protein n=1 Tax=Duganella caerulea TaxID=2885762 RepID=UPI0040382111